ncbi:hypothetical protein GIB67_002118 [Kingdonia uniflora]|uniref:Uncharacterized protein n=1 Tax=Kingdonia uniflora TaxID=39325 RepID=A0A7J7KWK0_9MAGN|nr:hypothetical protein GIB67_002118 [Kingdonia uniflora]
MIPLDMLMMQLLKEMELLFFVKRVQEKMENKLLTGMMEIQLLAIDYTKRNN